MTPSPAPESVPTLDEQIQFVRNDIALSSPQFADLPVQRAILASLLRLHSAPGDGLTQEQREACRAGAKALCDDWNTRYVGNREYFDKHAATLRALASPPSNGDANE